MDNPINILIVDDHELVRQGMRLLLDREADLHVVEDVGDLAEAMDALGRETVDLVIMDYSLKGEKGDDNTRTILKTYPELRVLATTSFDDRSTIEAMLKAGARGYVLKDAAKEDFLLAVRNTAAGRTHLGPDVADKLLVDLLPGEAQAPKPEPKPTKEWEGEMPDLTPREKEVLTLIAQEYTTKEIGEKLFISPKTVENHRINLMQKTGSRNLAGLVRLAMRWGLVE